MATTYQTGNAQNEIYVSFSLSNVLGLFPLRTFVYLEYKLLDDSDLHKATITSSKNTTIDIPKTLVGTEAYHKKGTVVIESHIGYDDGDDLNELLKALQFEYKIEGGAQGVVTYKTPDKKVPIKSSYGNKVIFLKIIDLV